MNKKVQNIAFSAMFIALLVVVQAVTAGFGNTIVTGSLVNAILIVAILTKNYFPAVATALVSPVVATLIGIGPTWAIVPFIALGNLTLVLVWGTLGKGGKGAYVSLRKVLALIVAAGLKFAVLFLGVTKLAIPVILALPEQKARAMSAAFSVPQLITASIGGVIALIIAPVIQKAVQRGSTR
jgi:hypothetical protein